MKSAEEQVEDPNVIPKGYTKCDFCGAIFPHTAKVCPNCKHPQCKGCD